MVDCLAVRILCLLAVCSLPTARKLPTLLVAPLHKAASVVIFCMPCTACSQLLFASARQQWNAPRMQAACFLPKVHVCTEIHIQLYGTQVFTEVCKTLTLKSM